MIRKKPVLTKFGKVNVQWGVLRRSSPSEDFPISQECPALLVHLTLTRKSDWEGQLWCHSGDGFLNAAAGDIAYLHSPQLEL